MKLFQNLGQYPQNASPSQQITMKRTPKKLELPQSFAQTLLDLQIEFCLAERPTFSTVKKLVELYSQGFEYYESIGNSKYRFFQQKINELYTSAKAIHAISHQQEPDTVPLKEQERINCIKMRKKQENLFHEYIQKTTEQASITSVKKIILDCDNKTVSLELKMRKQLTDQDERLRQKLLKRRSTSSLSRSFSSAGFIGGETDTKDSLFSDHTSQKQIQGHALEYSFSEAIRENESDEDEKVSSLAEL